jgi:ABC-2 type transport system ATP-binding protein
MVKIDGIKKDYGNFQLDITMDIPDGTVTGLIGRNGAGKTTLIKSILGLIHTDQGSITLFNKRSDRLTAADRQKIGAALADSGFSMVLTINDSIGILRRLYTDFDADRYIDCCKRFNLPLDKRLKTFSTGMKARLRVLIALCHNAQLLILDEPTTGLDVEARHEMLDMIRQYLSEDESRSLLISSHISSDLEGLCDNICLIDNGRIILQEEADAVSEHYAMLKVDEETYNRLDKSYIISTRKNEYSYSCFTNQKQYYIDNYPGIILENGNIDDLIISYCSQACEL